MNASRKARAKITQEIRRLERDRMRYLEKGNGALVEFLHSPHDQRPLETWRRMISIADNQLAEIAQLKERLKNS